MQRKAERSPRGDESAPLLLRGAVEPSRISSGGRGAQGIVQFESAMFFADEAEGVLTVSVMRLGCLDSTATVYYNTEDGSAEAGQSYMAAAGKLCFEPGEDAKSVDITLVPSPMWAATLEFKLHLHSPENCELGSYLHMARVKVIDSSYFPSDECAGRNMKDINGFFLLWTYFKWNYFLAGVRNKTILAVFMDQLGNAYALAMIYCQMYLVNVVCNPDEDVEDSLLLPDRAQTAYLLSAIIILPPFVLHLWEIARVKLDITGHSALFLQKSVFRKYLNYSEDVKADIKPEIFENAVTNECQAAASGYASALSALAIAGRIGVNMYFILRKSPDARAFAIGVPLFVGMWGWMRTQVWQPPSPKAHIASQARVLHETVSKYDIISAYFLRPMANESFVQRGEAVRARSAEKRVYMANTDFVVDALGPMCTGILIATLVPEVVVGNIRLGTFLATTRAVASISKECHKGFGTFRTLTAAFPPMRSIAVLLNKQTDLQMWKKVNRSRRAVTASLSSQLPGGHDCFPIRLTDVGYRLASGSQLFRDITVEAAQGQMVAVVGPHSSGKSTLLRLLAHQIFPTDGDIFVPAHLRILHVGEEGQWLERSLVENLTLGSQGRTAEDPARLRGILEDLGLTSVLQSFDAEVAGTAVQTPSEWVKTLTATDMRLLCLARALVMNPEVIVLQKPFILYRRERGLRIAQLLRDHITNRGLRLDPATAGSRRPRTVFFSTEDTAPPCADVVWALQPAFGLEASSPAASPAQWQTWTVKVCPPEASLDGKWASLGA